MKQHGKGIIALTACVGGLIPSLVLSGRDVEAYKYLNLFENIFDEVYLEVQPHDFPEQLLDVRGLGGDDRIFRGETELW